MCFLCFHHFFITNYPVLIGSATCNAACVAVRRFPLFPPTVKVTAPPMRPPCIRQLSATIYHTGRKPRATKAAAPPGAETKKKIRGTTWAPLKPPAHQLLLQIQFCTSVDCTLFWLVIYLCVCLRCPSCYSTGRPNAFKAPPGVYFALLSLWLWGRNDCVQLPQEQLNMHLLMQCIRNVAKDGWGFVFLLLFFYLFFKSAIDVLCPHLITCVFNMKRCFGLWCYREVATCLCFHRTANSARLTGFETKQVEGSLILKCAALPCAVTWCNKVLLE